MNLKCQKAYGAPTHTHIHTYISKHKCICLWVAKCWNYDCTIVYMCVCKRIRAIAKNFFITQCQWMHMNTHIHIYMCGCVCVWVCMHTDTNEIIDKCIYERYQLQTYLHWVQKQKKILSFILVFCTVVDEIFHAKSIFFNNDGIELSRQYHKTANIGARIFSSDMKNRKTNKID